MNNTLVGYLATRLAPQPENIATEALGYILRRSLDARRALAQISEELGVPISKDTIFRTQVTDADGARPDIVGESSEGARLLIEAKFWAGLTDAQPVAYLNNLPGAGSALLFVAPAQRAEILWRELLSRCARAGLSPGATASKAPEFRHAMVGNHALGLISWRALLQGIAVSVEAAGDAASSSDVRQLIGLCERMDSEAFLPLTGEELSAPIGRRIIQFGEIVDDLVDSLVKDGRASVKGLRAASANGWYGRYARIREYGILLHFNSWKWANWGCSPIWLQISGLNWKPSKLVREAVVRASIDFFDGNRGTNIPIVLPVGQERPELFKSAREQLLNVVQLLESLSSKDVPLTVPAEDTGDAPIEADSDGGTET